MIGIGASHTIIVPLYIILGRPRENIYVHDHLLFQINYIKLKPYFDKLEENWFLEALNFHKFKNVLFFLQMLRYFFVLFILSIFNFPVYREIYKAFDYLVHFRFDKVVFGMINISYKNALNVFFS